MNGDETSDSKISPWSLIWHPKSPEFNPPDVDKEEKKCLERRVQNRRAVGGIASVLR